MPANKKEKEYVYYLYALATLAYSLFKTYTVSLFKLKQLFNSFTVNVQLGHGDSWAEKTESQYSQPLILYKYKMEQYQSTIQIHVLFQSVYNLIIKLQERTVQQSM